MKQPTPKGTTIYTICDEYGDGTTTLEELQNRLEQPLYIRVDVNGDIYASVEPFELGQAESLRRDDSPLIVEVR